MVLGQNNCVNLAKYDIFQCYLARSGVEMLATHAIPANKHFIGRVEERERLECIQNEDEASIIVMYGRRRVGKTELLEQCFRERQLLKFEGQENGASDVQRANVMRQLSHYASDPLLAKVKTDSWLDVFDALHRFVKQGQWTLYFEEVQWLSCYQADFISQLKMAWDNQFRYNPQLVLILCGSSPSFMINQIMHSKALYNRSQYEFHLRELSLPEVRLLLPKKSTQEVMDAYLTVGGIPEYLQRLGRHSSVFTALCAESFLPEGYFVQEYARIFISSLAENPHYQAIMTFLGKRRFATRQEIAKHIKLSSGGRLSTVLQELVLCGFVEKYVPYNLAENSMLARYAIADCYIQFYGVFIGPQLSAIHSGKYQANPALALKQSQYQQWLGYAFERYCRKHAHHIAQKLGFGGVQYRSGVFYNRRALEADAGFQMDLVFDREDKVITVCEIKYTQAPVGARVIAAFEKKLTHFANPKNKTVHKVLITAYGTDNALAQRHYFDEVLTLGDLLSI